MSVPGSKVRPTGVAVTLAQTGPARTVMLRGCQAVLGTQNHSGKPTSPSWPEGGAVDGDSDGTRSSPYAWIISCCGVTCAVTVPVLTRMTTTPGSVPPHASSAQACPAGAGPKPSCCTCAGL